MSSSDSPAVEVVSTEKSGENKAPGAEGTATSGMFTLQKVDAPRLNLTLTSF